MRTPRPARLEWWRQISVNDRERGAAGVLTLLLTPALLGFAGLVLDGGRALAARTAATELAGQAARAGVGALDESALRTTGRDRLDPQRAPLLACRYVRAADPAATCRAGLDGPDALSVTVTTSTRTVLLTLVGVSRLHAAGAATATAVRGLDAPEARP